MGKLRSSARAARPISSRGSAAGSGTAPTWVIPISRLLLKVTLAPGDSPSMWKSPRRSNEPLEKNAPVDPPETEKANGKEVDTFPNSCEVQRLLESAMHTRV